MERQPHPGVLSRYGLHLPLTESTPRLSLGEGDTPLVRSQRLERDLGLDELYFKLEGCNPTGSFKDRGMVVAVAKAVESGTQAIVCASTGNTSASAAAYGARAGLRTYVLVPKGNIALGKLAQALAYGAQVLAIQGNFDAALSLVRQVCQRQPMTMVNSLNPNRIEGQKTAAFEVIDALGEAPDYLFIPVGNAGNITAYWKGFKEYHAQGRSRCLPKMMGFQAEGAAPIVRGHPIPNPETVATAIRIGNPASWKGATGARDESGGLIDMVSDEQILAAYKRLANEEGVFGEPASAAGVAGLIKLAAGGLDLQGKRAVCIITGNGLKDPDTAIRGARQLRDVPADLAAIERILAGE